MMFAIQRFHQTHLDLKPMPQNHRRSVVVKNICEKHIKILMMQCSESVQEDVKIVDRCKVNEEVWVVHRRLSNAGVDSVEQCRKVSIAFNDDVKVVVLEV